MLWTNKWHLDNTLTTHLQCINGIERISKAFAWSSWGLAGLAWFSAAGSLELVRVLLDHCVDTDKASKDNGATALHVAVYKGPEISERIPLVIQPQCIWWDNIIHPLLRITYVILHLLSQIGKILSVMIQLCAVSVVPLWSTLLSTFFSPHQYSWTLATPIAAKSFQELPRAAYSSVVLPFATRFGSSNLLALQAIWRQYGFSWKGEQVTWWAEMGWHQFCWQLSKAIWRSCASFFRMTKLELNTWRMRSCLVAYFTRRSVHVSPMSCSCPALTPQWKNMAKDWRDSYSCQGSKLLVLLVHFSTSTRTR